MNFHLFLRYIIGNFLPIFTICFISQRNWHSMLFDLKSRGWNSRRMSSQHVKQGCLYWGHTLFLKTLAESSKDGDWAELYVKYPIVYKLTDTQAVLSFVLIQRVLEILLSFIAIPSNRIWENHLRFGVIFHHSVSQDLGQLSAIRCFRVASFHGRSADKCKFQDTFMTDNIACITSNHWSAETVITAIK